MVKVWVEVPFLSVQATSVLIIFSRSNCTNLKVNAFLQVHSYFEIDEKIKTTCVQ